MTSLTEIFPTLGTDGVYVGIPLADHRITGLGPDQLQMGNRDGVIAALLYHLMQFYTPERQANDGTPIMFDPEIETRIESDVNVAGTTVSTRRYQIQTMTISFRKEIALPAFNPADF